MSQCLWLDGTESIADQDATLAGLIRRAGRPVVLAINKSDKIKYRDRAEKRGVLQRKLAFAPHHEALFVSGLKRQGISKLLVAVGKAYRFCDDRNANLDIEQVSAGCHNADASADV